MNNPTKLSFKIDLVDYIPNQIIPKLGSKKGFYAEISESYITLKASKCKTVTLPRQLELTNDDYLAIGLYFAEGYKKSQRGKKYNHSGEIDFSNSHIKSIIIITKFLSKFNIPHEDLRWKVGLHRNYEKTIDKEKLKNYWVEQVGLRTNNARPQWLYYTGKNGTSLSQNSSPKGYLQISYSSVLFRGFFLNLIEKIFWNCIKEKSKEKLSLILKGFFAGDGCVNYSEKHNRKQVEFLNNDLVLLEKIRKSLKILGLTSIRETWPDKTKTHTKALRIYNSHDFKLLQLYDIPNLLNYKRESFSKIMDSI